MMSEVERLAQELQEERQKNVELLQMLEREREERRRLEEAIGGGGKGHGLAQAQGGGGVGGDGVDSQRETDLLREKDAAQAAIMDLQRQLTSMQIERARVARQVEEEEDALSNALLRKLRIVTKEKEELSVQLSRSSRSSSLDGGGSVGDSRSDSYSVTSEMREAEEKRETQSVVSNISIIACTSDVSDMDLPVRKQNLPPPPFLVGEK